MSDDTDSSGMTNRQQKADAFLQSLFDGLPACRDKLLATLKELGCPVIEGEVVVHSATVVAVERDDILKYRSLFSSGSIAVLKYRPYKPESPRDGASAIAFIRQGFTNTWFRIGTDISTDFIDEIMEMADDSGDDFDEDDGDFIFDRPKMDTDLLAELSWRVACEPTFGARRSKAEREEFAVAYLRANGREEDVPDHWLPELARRADSYFQFGALPMLIKKLRGDGLKDKDIRESLGITQARLSRAASITPDALATNLAAQTGLPEL